MLEYLEAAAYLGIGLERVKQMVAEKILHPVKIVGTTRKRLRVEELDWYIQYRAGKKEPNPFARTGAIEGAELRRVLLAIQRDLRDIELLLTNQE